MLTNSTVTSEETELTQSPSKLEYQKLMSDNLNGNQLNSRILSYRNKPPAGPEGRDGNKIVLGSQLLKLHIGF